jgi:hypothetical protein
MQGVGDSAYQCCGESSTPRLNDTTPRIGDSRESFFEYEYLREFEAQIGTARKVV